MKQRRVAHCVIFSKLNDHNDKKSHHVDQKIEDTTTGLVASLAKKVHSISENNSASITEYIDSMKSEVNLLDQL
jgi:hypothetical protein